MKTLNVKKITSMADNKCRGCGRGISWGNMYCKGCGGTGISDKGSKQNLENMNRF